MRIKAIKTIIIYLLAFAVGLIIGFIQMPTHNDIKQIEGLGLNNQLLRIFVQNSMVISLIYVTSVFTPILSELVIAKNGYVLGSTIIWILVLNKLTLLLLLPHGIFEIPCLLSTSIIIEKGKTWFEEKPKLFIICWGIHIILVLVIALVEVLVTPQVYSAFTRQ